MTDFDFKSMKELSHTFRGWYVTTIKKGYHFIMGYFFNSEKSKEWLVKYIKMVNRLGGYG